VGKREREICFAHTEITALTPPQSPPCLSFFLFFSPLNHRPTLSILPMPQKQSARPRRPPVADCDSILSIPHAVRSVSNDLRFIDLLQCILVNKTWNELFSFKLYFSRTIHDCYFTEDYRQASLPGTSSPEVATPLATITIAIPMITAGVPAPMLPEPTECRHLHSSRNLPRF